MRTFFWCLCQLDKLPRYGRSYRYDSTMHRLERKPTWRRQCRGFWGLNLSHRLGLDSRYLDYLENVGVLQVHEFTVGLEPGEEPE